MTILPYTTKSKFIFDLRGEMAATSTNEVSSLSQAHFDEILVLMEIAAYNSLKIKRVVLILVLVEIATFIRSWLLSCLNPCFNGNCSASMKEILSVM